MIERHRIYGMSSPRMFTMRNDFGSWWAKSGLLDDRYKALFSWAKGDDDFWKQDIIGVVEFDKKASDGTPINGIITSVEIN